MKSSSVSLSSNDKAVDGQPAGPGRHKSVWALSCLMFHTGIQSLHTRVVKYILVLMPVENKFFSYKVVAVTY